MNNPSQPSFTQYPSADPTEAEDPSIRTLRRSLRGHAVTDTQGPLITESKTPDA